MHLDSSLHGEVLFEFRSLGINRPRPTPIHKTELMAFRQSRQASADCSSLVGWAQT